MNGPPKRATKHSTSTRIHSSSEIVLKESLAMHYALLLEIIK